MNHRCRRCRYCQVGEGVALIMGVIIPTACLSISSVVGCESGGSFVTKRFSNTCCYEKIEARCGELVVHARVHGRTFFAVLPSVSKAILRKGGVVLSVDADLNRIIARFPREYDLPQIKALLEQETSIRSIAYNSFVQHD